MDAQNPRPTDDIDGCRKAHERLAACLRSMTDDVARSPSRLPDWSVGHVVSHLARNAEAMVRRVDGAQRGQMVEQYPGGPAGRSAEIDAGASRSAEELIADAEAWSRRLDDTFASLPGGAWDLRVMTVRGAELPVRALPFRRWREVEVHLVDLGVGLEPAGWPQELVDRALPRLLDGLATRADERELMAWMLGRSPAPELDAWG